MDNFFPVIWVFVDFFIQLRRICAPCITPFLSIKFLVFSQNTFPPFRFICRAIPFLKSCSVNKFFPPSFLRAKTFCSAENQLTGVNRVAQARMHILHLSLHLPLSERALGRAKIFACETLLLTHSRFRDIFFLRVTLRPADRF